MNTERPTILVVDDDERNRKLLDAILSREGYAVLMAPSGERGLELAKTHLPNLILMDIRLQGMDGLTATRILKQDEKTRKIPVAALSANAMNDDIARAAEAGCSAYITKPFHLADFTEEVRRLVASQPASTTEV